MADVKVKDVMTHLVVMLYPKDTLHDAAQRLARNRISGAPVVEGGRVVGVVSESDLIHAATRSAKDRDHTSVTDILMVLATARPRPYPNGTTVAEVMSRSVVKISHEASVWQAAALMDRKGVKRLPVVDEDGYLAGVISRADLVKAMAKSDADMRADIVEAIEVLGHDCFEDLTVEVKNGVVTLSGAADRKSTHDLAVRLAGRTPGVLEVVDRLGYDIDDSKPIPSIAPDPRNNWVVDPAEVAR